MLCSLQVGVDFTFVGYSLSCWSDPQSGVYLNLPLKTDIYDHGVNLSNILGCILTYLDIVTMLTKSSVLDSFKHFYVVREKNDHVESYETHCIEV